MFKTFNFFFLSNETSVSIENAIEKQEIELIFDFSGKFKFTFLNLRNPFPVIVNAEVRRFFHISECDKSYTFRAIKNYRNIEYLKFLNFLERSIEEDLSIAIIGSFENQECRLLIKLLNKDLIRRGYKIQVDNL